MSLPEQPSYFQPAAARSDGDADLIADAVHLWYARIDRVDATTLERLASTLAEDERQRADAFLQDRDRQTAIVARGLLRAQLSGYTGVPPEELRFATIANGKPVLAPDRPGQTAKAPIHFNVSHSGGRILLGFTKLADIGVDIEALDRNLDDLLGVAENFFAPGETAALKSLDPERRRRGFLNCWTRKEAFIKVHGEGLQRDLNSFEVELRPEAPPRLLRLNGSETAAARYALHAVDPEPDYVAAICLPATAPEIRAFAWDGRFADGP